MSYNIVFSAYAVETYDSILAQIVYRWGNKVADDFEQRVIKVLDTIEHSPLIFQAIKDTPNIRKCVIHGN